LVTATSQRIQFLIFNFQFLIPAMILPILTVAPSQERGRGVFTTEFIPSGTVIEISPVLVLSETDRVEVEKTELYNYIFEWGENGKACCVALGYLSIYNHSYQANCSYEMEFEEERMRIVTVRDIDAGEELFINYNATPDDATPIWFEAN
jgi:SET domain-containing protein